MSISEKVTDLKHKSSSVRSVYYVRIKRPSELHKVSRQEHPQIKQIVITDLLSWQVHVGPGLSHFEFVYVTWTLLLHPKDPVPVLDPRTQSDTRILYM